MKEPENLNERKKKDIEFTTYASVVRGLHSDIKQLQPNEIDYLTRWLAYTTVQTNHRY